MICKNLGVSTWLLGNNYLSYYETWHPRNLLKGCVNLTFNFPQKQKRKKNNKQKLTETEKERKPTNCFCFRRVPILKKYQRW